MKRLLNSTAALSVALMNANPWPLMAQTLTETGAVVAADGTVLCEPTADVTCDPENAELIAKAEKIQAELAEAQAKADAEAADAQAATDANAATAVEADAQAQAAAQAKAEAEADAEAKAEAAAAADAEAKAKADEKAAEEQVKAQEAQAKADAKAADAAAKADEKAAEEQVKAQEAQAKADAKAAGAAAKANEKAAEAQMKAQEAQAKADAKAADAAAKADEKAAEEQAKAEAKAAEADAKAKADAEAAKADAQAQDQADAAAKAKADAKAADADASAKPEAQPPAEPQAAEPASDAETLAAQAEARAKAEAELGVKADGTIADPNAGLKTAAPKEDPTATPVEAPVVSEEQMNALSTLLGGAAAGAAAEAAAPIAATEAGQQPADAAPSAEAVTETTETVTEGTARSATEEFAAAPEVVAPGKKSGLSNLEKAGLLGLGALVVGSILKNNASDAVAQPQQQVVSNTGDRVVVLQPDGSYQVFKDDDALLRQPGNTLRTETYKDGSSRTVVDRADGSQIVTVRNATGRVLRRAHYDRQGKETILINDLAEETAVNVSTLPPPPARPAVISARDGDVALKAALAQREIAKIGRTFSLRQVREIPQVRHLAATIGVDNITFATGSAALTTAQVDELADLGEAMQQLLDENKNEVFLIEGHTDATGKGAMNLALSDRRAETVALALTEYFDIPAENMVVQGYGETELLIDTQADEKRNRRVAVRIITPLL